MRINGFLVTTWSIAASSLIAAGSGAGAAAAAATQQEARPVEAVPELDLDRYAGLWYEIARLPNRFQDDCVGDVTVRYESRDDGGIDLINRCAEEDGDWDEAKGFAKVADDDGPASKLRVRFAPGLLGWLPWVWADHWVVALDEDYRWAAVGTPDRGYLWILSREPRMDEAIYERLTGELVEMGFRIGRLERTAHSGRAG